MGWPSRVSLDRQKVHRWPSWRGSRRRQGFDLGAAGTIGGVEDGLDAVAQIPRGAEPAAGLRGGSGSDSKCLAIELKRTVTGTLVPVIGRLLLQQILAAPFGKPAKDITDDDPSCQMPQTTYLCALALPL